MSTTVDRPLTVKAARRLLSDTRRASADQINEAQMLLHDLRSRRPDILPTGGLCVVHCQACGNATWSLHSDGDDERWACDKCHRPPMSSKEAWALKDAQREQADRLKAQEAAEIAARPKPREALATVAKELTEARDEEGRLALASEKARDALVGARAGLDAAEQALVAARSRNAEDNVTALLSGKTKPQRGVAAETSALEAARNGLELATTATATIEDMLAEVRYGMRKLSEQHRAVALRVLADEAAPIFAQQATKGRNEYVAGLRGLRSLADIGAEPSSLVPYKELDRSWHNAPQNWNTGDQRGPDLDSALKALLRDPTASTADLS